MSLNVEAFDDWIRSAFVDLNTELENLYFQQEDRSNVGGVGDKVKLQLREEGNVFVKSLMTEGNTDEGFERAFDLLGNLGLYMAALRRHELTNPAREEKSPFHEASALGLHIGASIGVTPRFATSHLATHNSARNGVQKSFTSLKDEILFIDYNTRGILAYKRAADALMRIVPLNVSHSVSLMLFDDAKAALEDVSRFNKFLFENLDANRFFFSVRPYYKPYRVGRMEYRGANAGDFSGINEIDLLLGLCQANDPSYAQILVDKMLFMMPSDQASLRDCMRRRNFLDQFLDAPESERNSVWFQKNARAFLDVCEAHGESARQHHDMLIKKFIEAPSRSIGQEHLKQITASGPPLPVLLNSLEKLRDQRLAADRSDIVTSHDKLNRLKAAAGWSSSGAKPADAGAAQLS